MRKVVEIVGPTNVGNWVNVYLAFDHESEDGTHHWAVYSDSGDAFSQRRHLLRLGFVAESEIAPAARRPAARAAEEDK